MASRVRWIALVLAAAIVAGCGGGGSAAQVLTGTVGPGFTISLDDAEGRLVTSLKPGQYDVTIHDRSAFLNFHLFGPGVSEATSIPGTGTSRWSVAFRRGVYQYQCDAHKTLVHGLFRVS